jgi:hypothetical protein
MKLTEKQKEAWKLFNGPAHNVLLYGGSRAAKTFGATHYFVTRALAEPNSNHVIFRLKKSDLIGSMMLGTFPEVLRLRFPNCHDDGNFVHLNQDKSCSYARFFNGSKIFFTGLEDRKGFGKVLGTDFSGGLFDECSEIPYEAYNMFKPRLAQKNRLKKIWIGAENPPYTKIHWTYQMFFDFMIPNESKPITQKDDYVSLQMNPTDNLENLDPDYIKTAFADAPERNKKRFLYGEFGDGLEAGIFTEYVLQAEQEGRITDDINMSPHLPVSLVFDVGMEDPTAVWVVQFFEDAVLFLDYMEGTHKFLVRYIQDVWAKGYIFKNIFLPWETKAERGGTMTPAREVSMMGCNPSAPESKQFITHVLKKPVSTWADIDVTRSVFGKMFFRKTPCSKGIDALKNYRADWKEMRGIWSKEPVHDWTSHAADALRYTVQAFRYEPPEKRRPNRDPNHVYADEIIGLRWGSSMGENGVEF